MNSRQRILKHWATATEMTSLCCCQPSKLSSGTCGCRSQVPDDSWFWQSLDNTTGDLREPICGDSVCGGIQEMFTDAIGFEMIFGNGDGRGVPEWSQTGCGHTWTRGFQSRMPHHTAYWRRSAKLVPLSCGKHFPEKLLSVRCRKCGLTPPDSKGLGLGCVSRRCIVVTRV